MFFSGFRGGIHPDDHKEQTKDRPITDLEPCDTLTFLMSQGGRGTVPVVKKGDIVKKGQIIGESGEFMSSPIHSSVSGIVESVTRVITPKGDMSEAVIIKNDFTEEEEQPFSRTQSGYVSLKELIEITKKAGIVGMGGAGFPTHVKLSTDKKIDTVIINASECEPYLTSDYRILKEEPEDMIDGLDLLIHALGIRSGIIALEDNKRDAVKKLSQKLKSSMKIKLLKTKYPQGSEKQLIRSVTGRYVPEGGLPADVGVLVFNVDTASAISRAVRRGVPVTSRIVTVAGSAVKNPSNFRVKIGTPFSYVFEKAGGFTKQPLKIIAGGPMMGTSQYSIDIPVTKTTSGLLALTEKELGVKSEDKCIRCGTCVSACPMGLEPLQIVKCVNDKEWEEAKKIGLMSCIECGCCAYSCPSDRNPVAVIRRGKAAVRSGR